MTLAPLRAAGVAVGPFAVHTSALEQLRPREAWAFFGDLEAAGTAMIWLSEVLGREAFTAAQAALQATQRLVVGTGVARALERVPKSAAAASGYLWDAYPGRYVLGLGVSGASRERGVGPLPFMRDYLRDLDESHLRVGRDPRPPRVLGAYSQGITRLARDHADGLLTFMVTPEHTSWARSVLGPEPFLAVSHRVIFDANPRSARELARQQMAYYLELPHQQNKLRRLGFGEDDFADGGSDRLIDAMFAWGTAEDVAETLRAHMAAGADHLAVSHEQPPSARLIEHLHELQARLATIT